MAERGRPSSGGDTWIARTADVDSGVSAVGIVVLLAGSWVVTYALGGSQTVGPQLFHVPVVLAAARFGARSALLTSLAAGILCGPLMPLDVVAGEAQPLANWAARLVLFVLIGQIVAALQSRSLATARQHLTDQAVRRRHIQALADGAIQPLFQPIVDLDTGAVRGVEALARWHHPDGTVVPPAEFIPDAERIGTIVDIDAAILAASCRALAAWIRDLDLPDDFHVAVNLSACDLDDGSIARRVASHLADHDLAPHRLVLELTETSLASDKQAAIACLERLSDLGVGIALDDFGVGNSSLGSLPEMPINRFKVDRSFTRAVTSGTREAALVAGVIRLAESLSLDAPIVEGIETPEQLAALRDAGAQWGQGSCSATRCRGRRSPSCSAAGASTSPTSNHDRRQFASAIAPLRSVANEIQAR